MKEIESSKLISHSEPLTFNPAQCGTNLEISKTETTLKWLKHVGWWSAFLWSSINGVFQFDIKILKSKNMEIMIGVSTKQNQLLSYFPFSDEGWGLYLSHGKIYHNNDGQFYTSRKIFNGDIIRTIVDVWNGNLIY